LGTIVEVSDDMGWQDEHAKILSSLLELPEACRWPKEILALGKFHHKSTKEVKCESREKATEEEVILTNIPNSSIEHTLIEDAVPRY